MSTKRQQEREALEQQLRARDAAAEALMRAATVELRQGQRLARALARIDRGRRVMA